MMKHIYMIMFALANSFACVSCDEHEPIDLDILHPLFGWSDSESFGFQ